MPLFMLRNNVMFLLACPIERALMTTTIANCYNTSSNYVRSELHSHNYLDFSAYLNLLQGCIQNKALSHGKLIHASMAKVGFTKNLILQNTLANMYVKCGRLEDARQVFDKMPYRDVFSCTVMIAAYARDGLIEEALALFAQMPRMCIQPNEFTFATAISFFSGFTDLENGAEIHGKVIMTGFEHDVVVGNALINMYAKRGRIEMARKVFDKMPQRDIVSWNSMIAGYAQGGSMDEALTVFDEMPQRNAVSWNTIIAGCAKIGFVDEALELFKQMPRQDTVSWTALISGYARSGHVNEALKHFMEMPQQNVVSWNAIIAGFAQSGHGEESLELFQKMQLVGMRPDFATYLSIIPVCGSLGAMQEGMEIHGKIVRTGFQIDVMVVNALIDMYGKCRNIERAQMLFDKMHQPDDVSWTSMISGYAHNGLIEEALELFNDMPQQNLISWNAIIAGVAQNGHYEKALELFQEMKLAGVRPDEKTLTSILQVSANLESLQHGMEIHEVATRSGFQSDAFVMTALINMYAQCGSLVKAWKLFDQMHEHDLVAWNVMILGYVHNGHIDEALGLLKEIPQQDIMLWNATIACLGKHGYDEVALKLFQQMQLVGLWPDSKSFASILSVCANLATLGEGMMIHAQITRNGFLLDLLVVNSLIHMYAKCGSIEKALHIFQSMHYRDVVSWNAMIAGYAMHGYGKEAIKLFEQMEHYGVNPDRVTLVSVLSACNHAGLVDEAYHYFNCIPDYNITRTAEHYICMVDLLGRVGLLNEAQDVINSMPIKPNSAVWSCFLSACTMHDNIELGEYIAEHLLELNLKDAAPYVLLSNMYAAVGRWDNIESVRKRMKDRGIRKKPGCSWIEVNKQVHVFFVQNKSNYRSH